MQRKNFCISEISADFFQWNSDAKVSCWSNSAVCRDVFGAKKSKKIPKKTACSKWKLNRIQNLEIFHSNSVNRWSYRLPWPIHDSSIWFWVNHSEDPARKIRETARVITPPESWFSKIFTFERVLKKRSTATPSIKENTLPKGFPGHSQALASADAIRIFYADIQSSHRCPGRCRFSSILRPWWEFLASIWLMRMGPMRGKDVKVGMLWDPIHLERLCSQQSFANTIFVSWSFM